MSRSPAACAPTAAAALAAVVVLAAVGCTRGTETTAAATPGATPPRPIQTLSAADLQMFLAVRGKALTRLEDETTETEKGIGSVLGHVADMSVAEQDAAAALGFEWRHYRWVREEVARLFAAQRQREDADLLAVELTRARDDLRAQIAAARDPASRQFLEAQVATLDAQLEKLAGSRKAPASEAKAMELIGGVRAELAVQQGRQERIAKRLRDLVQRERSGTAPTAPPT